MIELREAVVRVLSELSQAYKDQCYASILAGQPDNAKELAIRADELRRAISVIAAQYKKLKEQ